MESAFRVPLFWHQSQQSYLLLRILEQEQGMNLYLSTLWNLFWQLPPLIIPARMHPVCSWRDFRTILFFSNLRVFKKHLQDDSPTFFLHLRLRQALSPTNEISSLNGVHPGNRSKGNNELCFAKSGKTVPCENRGELLILFVKQGWAFSLLCRPFMVYQREEVLSRPDIVLATGFFRLAAFKHCSVLNGKMSLLAG